MAWKTVRRAMPPACRWPGAGHRRRRQRLQGLAGVRCAVFTFTGGVGGGASFVLGPTGAQHAGDLFGCQGAEDSIALCTLESAMPV